MSTRQAGFLAPASLGTSRDPSTGVTTGDDLSNSLLCTCKLHSEQGSTATTHTQWVRDPEATELTLDSVVLAAAKTTPPVEMLQCCPRRSFEDSTGRLDANICTETHDSTCTPVLLQFGATLYAHTVLCQIDEASREYLLLLARTHTSGEIDFECW
jgi:hypothetical protein